MSYTHTVISGKEQVDTYLDIISEIYNIAQQHECMWSIGSLSSKDKKGNHIVFWEGFVFDDEFLKDTFWSNILDLYDGTSEDLVKSWTSISIMTEYGYTIRIRICMKDDMDYYKIRHYSSDIYTTEDLEKSKCVYSTQQTGLTKHQLKEREMYTNAEWEIMEVSSSSTSPISRTVSRSSSPVSSDSQSKWIHDDINKLVNTYTIINECTRSLSTDTRYQILTMAKNDIIDKISALFDSIY